MQLVLPCFLLVTASYLFVTSGYLIVTTGYFSLLPVTSGYFWFLVLVTTILNNQKQLSKPLVLPFVFVCQRFGVITFMNLYLAEKFKK